MQIPNPFRSFHQRHCRHSFPNLSNRQPAEPDSVFLFKAGHPGPGVGGKMSPPYSRQSNSSYQIHPILLSHTRHLSKRFGAIALHIEGHETFTKKKILTPDYDLFMTRIHGNSSQLEPLANPFDAAWERSAGFEFTDSPVMRDPEHSEFVYISSAAIAGGQSGWIALEFWGSVPAPL